jgi:hypothetical protein
MTASTVGDANTACASPAMDGKTTGGWTPRLSPRKRSATTGRVGGLKRLEQVCRPHGFSLTPNRIWHFPFDLFPFNFFFKEGRLEQGLFTKSLYPRARGFSQAQDYPNPLFPLMEPDLL